MQLNRTRACRMVAVCVLLTFTVGCSSGGNFSVTNGSAVVTTEVGSVQSNEITTSIAEKHMPEIEAYVLARLQRSIDPAAETQIDSFDSATVLFAAAGQPIVVYVAQANHDGGGDLISTTSIEGIDVEVVSSPRDTRVWRFRCSMSTFGERSVDVEPQRGPYTDGLAIIPKIYNAIGCTGS